MSTISTVLGDFYLEDQGHSDAPVAMLWPSLFCDHSMWREQVSGLREIGFRTLALDPPGHGRSPGPGRRFSMDECAQAALQVLDACGVRSPALFLGTSWGGFVAPRLAQLASHRLRGLILFNTSADRPTLADRAKAWLLTKLCVTGALHDKMANTAVTSMLWASTRSSRPELAIDLVQKLSAWDGRRVATTIRSVLVDRLSVLDVLSEINLPTLIVSGEDDPIFVAVHSERLAARLLNARLVEIPNAAHLVPLETPAAANELVIDFVKRLPSI